MDKDSTPNEKPHLLVHWRYGIWTHTHVAPHFFEGTLFVVPQPAQQKHTRGPVAACGLVVLRETKQNHHPPQCSARASPLARVRFPRSASGLGHLPAEALQGTGRAASRGASASFRGDCAFPVGDG